MAKISRKYVDPENFGDYVNNLWSSFILMNSKEEVRLLFKDLFTHTEFKMFAKRLEIARRLLENQRYESIERDLAVTSATIATISNLLVEKGDGFRLAHERLSKWEEKNMVIRRKRQKDLENPFRQKIKQHNQTILGSVLAGSIKELDKKLSKNSKQKSLKDKLKI